MNKLLTVALAGSSLLLNAHTGVTQAVPAAAPPWLVPAQVTIKKQPMTFTNVGAQLSGTLHYPEGRSNLAAVIVFHGSGEPSQDAQLYTHLKQMLPPLGVAVFVFDRRGSGQSGGGEQGVQGFDVLSDDGVAGQVNRATVERMLDAAEPQPWFSEIFLGRSMIEPSSSWRREIESDPMRSLHQSRVPTLLIFGQQDVWIPVAETIRLLKGSDTHRGDLTIRVISGASHEMMLGTDPKDEIDPAFFPSLAPNAPEYFALLSSWLAERGFAKAELP